MRGPVLENTDDLTIQPLIYVKWEPCVNIPISQKESIMKIPYRTRRALRRLGFAALIVLLVAIVAWMCWVVWLERFVVYSRDGATLNFDLPAEYPEGQVALPPEPGETISIYFNEGEDEEEISTELTRISGYYITAEALTDVNAIRSQLKLLESETPVMLEVKDPRGAFHYSTAVGSLVSGEVDAAEVDQLIADLASSGHYLIAKLPAMRDREFGLNNVNSGLFAPSLYSLWMDEGGCYWLNPSASGTMVYLTSIIEELKALGFDEVVFSHFYFPAGDGYVFDGDKSAALTQAAQSLVTACSTDTFAVSFVRGSTYFTVPEGRCRIYLENVDAASVDDAAADFGFTDPAIRLVFLSDSNDTRYDEYSILRPLENAH